MIKSGKPCRQILVWSYLLASPWPVRFPPLNGGRASWLDQVDALRPCLESTNCDWPRCRPSARDACWSFPVTDPLPLPFAFLDGRASLGQCFHGCLPASTTRKFQRHPTRLSQAITLPGLRFSDIPRASIDYPPLPGTLSLPLLVLQQKLLGLVTTDETSPARARNPARHQSAIHRKLRYLLRSTAQIWSQQYHSF